MSTHERDDARPQPNAAETTADPHDPAFGGIARLHMRYLQQRGEAHRQLLQVHTAALGLLVEQAQALRVAPAAAQEAPAPPAEEAPPQVSAPAPRPGAFTLQLPAQLRVERVQRVQEGAIQPGDTALARREGAATPLRLGDVLEAALRSGLVLARDALRAGARPHFLEGTLQLHRALGEASGGLEISASVRSAVELRGEQKLDLEVEISDGGRLASAQAVLALAEPASLAQREALAPGRLSGGSTLGAPLSLRSLPGAERLLAGQRPLLLEIVDSRPGGGRAGLGTLLARLDAEALAAAAPLLPGEALAPGIALEGALQALRLSALLHAPDAIPPGEVAWSIPLGALSWAAPAPVTLQGAPLEVELEVTQRASGPDGLELGAEAWLVREGRVLLHVRRLTSRLHAPQASASAALAAPGAPQVPPGHLLSPAQAPWLEDYCPAFTTPVLPLLFVADLLVQAALKDRPGEVVFKLERLVMARWFVLREPLELQTSVELTRGRRAALAATLLARPVSSGGAWEEVASARLIMAPSFGPCLETLEPLQDATPLDDPYTTAATFHGPAFQLLRGGAFDGQGAVGRLTLDAPGGLEVGAIHPAALEAGLHLATSQALTRWSSEIHPRLAAYPIKLERATFHAPPPTRGAGEVQLRFEGLLTGPRFPTFTLHYRSEGVTWATLQLVCVLAPQPRFQQLAPAERRAFARERRFVQGAGLSRFEGESTRVRATDLQAADWVEGTVAELYRVQGDAETQARLVGVKDHLAQRLHLHPSQVEVELARGVATAPNLPAKRVPFRVQRDFMAFVVSDAGEPELDPAALEQVRRRFAFAPGSLGADLLRVLLGQLLGVVTTAAALPKMPALYLLGDAPPVAIAILAALVPLLTGTQLVMLPDRAALPGWLERLLTLLTQAPGGAFPAVILPEHLARTLSPPSPLNTSALLIARSPSYALQTARQLLLPVVPVSASAPGVGTLGFPEALAPLHLALGTPREAERLDPGGIQAPELLPIAARALPRRELFAEAGAWSLARQVELPWAILFKLLQSLDGAGEQTQTLVEAAARGRADVPDTPEGRWLAAWVPLLLGPELPVRWR